MPLTPLKPNTILLSDRSDVDIINHIPVIDTGAKPGHFVELYSSSGTLAWRKVTSAVNVPSKFILLEQDIYARTLDTAYNSGEPGIVAALDVADEVWPILPSGQNITCGDPLQQNGDGKLKEATAVTAATNVAHYVALETLGAITADTRCRVMIVQ